MGNCLSPDSKDSSNKPFSAPSIRYEQRSDAVVSNPSAEGQSAPHAWSRQLVPPALHSYTSSSQKEGKDGGMSSCQPPAPGPCLGSVPQRPTDQLARPDAHGLSYGIPEQSLDSQTSAYTDAMELRPGADGAVASVAPHAHTPSVATTPAASSNPLMHLNRATILQNRMGPGGALPPMPVRNNNVIGPPTCAGGPGPPVGAQRHHQQQQQKQPTPQLPVATTGPGVTAAQPPGAPAGQGFAGSGTAASVGSFNTEMIDDSGLFDGPLSVVQPVCSTADAYGGGALGGHVPCTGLPAIAVSHTPGPGGAGCASLGAFSGALGAALSSGMSAFTTRVGNSAGVGTVFGTPLHGLGVEAALCEMQQMALIGAGNGGCVYIGRWRGVMVAIKFIVSSNDDQLVRSQREALLSRLASHPHVIQTYATSVTQLTEQMFRPKEPSPGDPQQGGALAASDPNISHDLLTGLNSGSWLRGELQLALHGSVGSGNSSGANAGTTAATAAAPSPAAGAAAVPPPGVAEIGHGLASVGVGPLPTIMETARSLGASRSTSVSGRTAVGGGGGGPQDGFQRGSLSIGHGACEGDWQLSSSSSVHRAKGPLPDATGPASSGRHSGQQQNEGMSSSVAHWGYASDAGSSAGAQGRLLQTGLTSAGPHTAGGPGAGSAPTSTESTGAGAHAPDSSGRPCQPDVVGAGGVCSGAATAGAAAEGGTARATEAGATAGTTPAAGATTGEGATTGAGTGAPAAAAACSVSAAAAAATAAAGGRGQQSGGVADSFDASFVRDHLGRTKYSVHEVLRQLGAHEGQFLTMVVMEYCDGGSLLAALKEGPFQRDTTSWSPRMLLRSTVRTALEIAHGMQHLHLSGLVHGDLKPGNILLKGSNQDKRKFVAKVSDLGLVHPVGTADEMAIDDGQIGAIAFMAPEVFRGRVMKASDVYSFGVVLWQMVCGTGTSPYEGAHPMAIALGVSEGKMALRWPPGVFRPLQQLGELCTRPDPAARPSFKSVVGALEKLERHMQRLAAAGGAGGASTGHSSNNTSNGASLLSPPPSAGTQQPQSGSGGPWPWPGMLLSGGPASESGLRPAASLPERGAEQGGKGVAQEGAGP